MLRLGIGKSSLDLVYVTRVRLLNVFPAVFVEKGKNKILSKASDYITTKATLQNAIRFFIHFTLPNPKR